MYGVNRVKIYFQLLYSFNIGISFLNFAVLVCQSLLPSVHPLIHPSVQESVTFLNCKQSLKYCPFLTLRNCDTKYLALFQSLEQQGQTHGYPLCAGGPGQ